MWGGPGVPLGGRRALIALGAARAPGPGVPLRGHRSGATAPLPPIHHMYVIVLENESASTTFGAGSPAPYLAKTLRAQGAYLPNYYGIGHISNDNYIAMISRTGAERRHPVRLPDLHRLPCGTTGAYGQAHGTGCVYPAGVPTIASPADRRRARRGATTTTAWAPTRRARARCAATRRVNGRDSTQSATATDQYATRHNPFVYFHSIIDNTTLCDSHVVNLDQLPQDLPRRGRPTTSFITPNLCNDGHDATCPNGGPGASPRRTRSCARGCPDHRLAAFKQDGDC